MPIEPIDDEEFDWDNNAQKRIAEQQQKNRDKEERKRKIATEEENIITPPPKRAKKEERLYNFSMRYKNPVHLLSVITDIATELRKYKLTLVIFSDQLWQN